MTPILCVGAAHWDVIGRAGAPLAVGGDVPGRIERRMGGVALNVALALADIGRAAALISAVGRDGGGDALIAEAEARGVDCGGLTRFDGPSDAYLVIEGLGGEVFAAVADCAGLERVGRDVLAALRARGWAGRMVVDSNLPEAVLEEILRGAALAGAEIAFAPASPGKADRLAAVFGARRGAVYLNRREAEALCGVVFAGSRDAALALVARGAIEAIVTDGAGAASHAWAAGVVERAPPAVAPRSLTGAGDAFLAAHLVAREAGHGPAAALDAALAATARHITREAS